MDEVIEGLPDQVRRRVETVIEAVQSVFSFLAVFGYALDRVELPENELHKYWTNIILVSNQAGRGITFSYFPYDHKGQASDGIGVSITRTHASDTGDEGDFNVYKDYMEFVLYVKKKRPQADETVFDTEHYEGPFAERVHKVLAAYAYYMKEVADDVIKGEYWEAGHFHDWHEL